uniref:Protein Wnt n=1 Tax=Ciona savignyi TaxID=51511 RepID=H2YME7_CIOSA
QICRRHYSMMTSVADAAQMALKECQKQFETERWNCSTPPQPRRHRRSVFGRELLSGTRERSFVYALSSAAVAYAITRDCSLGNIVGCGCDQTWPQRAPFNQSFDWGGCSDNIRWGVEMSKLFVDAQEYERGRQKRIGRNRRRRRKREINERTVNLNNNKFGREAILSGMGKKCRCHGISNSCESMTCWRTLPSFRKVGRILKRSYSTAVQVIGKLNPRFKKVISNDSPQFLPRVKCPPGFNDIRFPIYTLTRSYPTNLLCENPFLCVLFILHRFPIHLCNHKYGRYLLRPRDRDRRSVGNRYLAFLRMSSDFCATTGRTCDADKSGPSGCDVMCCGRGYVIKTSYVTAKCGCKFSWCCDVTCKSCNETRVEYVCL